MENPQPGRLTDGLTFGSSRLLCPQAQVLSGMWKRTAESIAANSVPAVPASGSTWKVVALNLRHRHQQNKTYVILDSVKGYTGQCSKESEGTHGT